MENNSNETRMDRIRLTYIGNQVGFTIQSIQQSIHQSYARLLVNESQTMDLSI